MTSHTHARHGRTVLWAEMVRDRLGLGRRKPPFDARIHLDAAMDWIARAQDVGDDDGVSRQFHLRHGWRPSYPETTGYIVETAIDYADLAGDPTWLERAKRMSAWLLEERLPDGSVYGGDTNVKVRAPAIFNTGMVLHGLLRAVDRFDIEGVEPAALRMIRFLLDSQDDDGCWRRNLSRLTHGSIHTYNTRVAWALALAGRRFSERAWLDAAERNVTWALGQRNDVGWFAHNDLTRDDEPLTHTIAYALRGILETAFVLDRDAWVDSVRQSAERLLDHQRPDGSLPGRFYADWTPAVDWVCLTGVSQLAIVWLRLAERLGAPRFREAAVRANRYVMSTQRLDAVNAGVRGGVKGSFPVWGGYIQSAYPNWAAKFLAEALIEELRPGA